jgi:hypothetical protein
LNFSFAGSLGERLQIQFLIAWDDRHAEPVAVAARDQRLEYLFRREANLPGHCFRRQVIDVHIVFAQFVVNPQLVEDARGVGLGRHGSIVSS